MWKLDRMPWRVEGDDGCKAEIESGAAEFRPSDGFIACALAGDAEVVISVDKDILTLGSLMTVQMMTPHGFVALSNARKVPANPMTVFT
jgi:hypothetical protein